MDKTLVVDATGHIAGRLGTHIAKKLLEGYTVTVLCAESIVLTGPLHRSKLRYKEYLNKKCLVNPRKGPYHYKEPSKLFIRLVKRMVPHKKVKGQKALAKLSVFEGIPSKFEGVPRSICPRALLSFKANPIRKSATYGELLFDFGWKYGEMTQQMRENVLKREQAQSSTQAVKKEDAQRTRESDSFRKEVDELLSRIE